MAATEQPVASQPAGAGIGKGGELTKPVASNPPGSQFTNGLLVASGTAFLGGILGSLWYQGRQERRKGINHVAASPALQTLADVKRTESLLKEGRLLGLKAFAIATTICLSGAVLVVGATRWALDVETIPEFSAKMRDLFPKQKTKFVNAVVGTDRSVFGDHSTESGATLTSSATAAAVAADDEKDLDNEEDSNILRRIERELMRLEKEEEALLAPQSPAGSAAPASS
ncbi:hypothetical protein EDD11_001406 [Mortierella claussenii]|nr:hypothetical protein EDD11_001406 [Mortierella claussenii]